MGEETAFENGRISDFEGLVTLTLGRVILHTVMHHSSTSTYVPNFIEIEENFCGQTYGHMRPIVLGRLGGVVLMSQIRGDSRQNARIRGNGSNSNSKKCCESCEKFSITDNQELVDSMFIQFTAINLQVTMHSGQLSLLSSEISVCYARQWYAVPDYPCGKSGKCHGPRASGNRKNCQGLEYLKMLSTGPCMQKTRLRVR